MWCGPHDSNCLQEYYWRSKQCPREKLINFLRPLPSRTLIIPAGSLSPKKLTTFKETEVEKRTELQKIDLIQSALAHVNTTTTTATAANNNNKNHVIVSVDKSPRYFLGID